MSDKSNIGTPCDVGEPPPSTPPTPEGANLEDTKKYKKTIRFTKSEIEQIEKKLKEHNLSFSEFARNAILCKKINSKISIKLVYEINKIGNNLNQVAKRVNTLKRLDQDVLGVLIDIDKKMDELKEKCL